MAASASSCNFVNCGSRLPRRRRVAQCSTGCTWRGTPHLAGRKKKRRNWLGGGRSSRGIPRASGSSNRSSPGPADRPENIADSPLGSPPGFASRFTRRVFRIGKSAAAGSAVCGIDHGGRGRGHRLRPAWGRLALSVACLPLAARQLPLRVPYGRQALRLHGGHRRVEPASAGPSRSRRGSCTDARHPGAVHPGARPGRRSNSSATSSKKSDT